MATLTELIRQEDPKRPYTDEQLAQMLQLRREQVVELRRINGIPNSWMRLRPALVVEMQKLLEQEPGFRIVADPAAERDGLQCLALSGKGTAQQFARKRSRAAA